MHQTIENKHLVISIQNKGIELCSIISKATGTEYMWDAQPNVWGSHAPVLFPVIGQTRPEGYLHKGKKFHVPRHGFIRNNESFKTETTNDTISYTLSSDEETLRIYPFSFIFQVSFQLKDNTIHIKHYVQNTSNETMYFSLGAHPAFRCPWNDKENYSDYYLEFEKEENSDRWQIGENGLLEEEPKSFFSKTKLLHLTTKLFDSDALVFKDLQSQSVNLKSKSHKQYLTVDFKDFPYFAIWAKPNAQFICIEPWLGIGDSNNSTEVFSKKEGILPLEAHSSFKASYSITINDQ